MKTKLPWMLTAVLAIALATVMISRAAQAPVQPAAATATQKKVLYWVDPMHPEYKSDKPGKAPDCGMDLVPVYEDGTTSTSSAGTPAGYVPIKVGGVPTAVAERRTLGQSVRTVARITGDETRQFRVTTKFDGFIEKLYVDFTGKEIRRGQPLFTIYSPELLASQQEYLLALRAAKQSPALLEAARRRLALWDISDREVRELERTGVTRKAVTIAAPTTGIVVNKMAVEGAKVMAGEPLFEIANLDRVWAVADVYESDLPFARIGAPVTMTLSYIPGRTWKGRVAFVAPVVDPMTRTVKVRIELDNRDAALKPDMFADVVIEGTTHEATVVPDSAVIATGTRSIVFVSAGGELVPREVQTGMKSGDFIEIRSGVEPGQAVATQANFLIDSESRLKAALQR
jgi:multidrug efflux pump subunit AcrA (membrane-fusion protein)